MAVSGGVDSSTTAAILIEQGHEVQGMYMVLGDEKSSLGLKDARCVADHLGIPLHVLQLKPVFEERIVDYFIGEYGLGRTPNPCILCNRGIKFDRLIQLADELGIQKIATGHYARSILDETTGQYKLLKGKDLSKDQSYFLFMLPQKVLPRVVWPLGEMTKAEVRRLAGERKLPSADRSESQEICFIPDNDYRAFISERLPAADRRGGDITDVDGNVLKKHDGIHGFTVGQRRGLGIPWREPLYVLRILPDENRVVVGTKDRLSSTVLTGKNASWIEGSPPADVFDARARIRYRHKEADARIEVLSGDAIRVRFREPQKAVTPGQAVVLYRGDEVLGGAWIEEAMDVPEC